MSETAQAKESVKATRHRLRLRRFSMVQLLIALALLFFFAPFVEAIKGGDLIVSGLLSLVLFSAVLAVASGPRRRHRTKVQYTGERREAKLMQCLQSL